MKRYLFLVICAFSWASFSSSLVSDYVDGNGKPRDPNALKATLIKWLKKSGFQGAVSRLDVQLNRENYVDTAYIQLKMINKKKKGEFIGIWVEKKDQNNQIGVSFRRNFRKEKALRTKHLDFGLEDSLFPVAKEMSALEFIQNAQALDNFNRLKNLNAEQTELMNQFRKEVRDFAKGFDFVMDERAPIVVQKQGEESHSWLAIKLRPSSKVKDTRFKFKYLELGIRLNFRYFSLWANMVTPRENPLSDFALEQTTGIVQALLKGKLPEITLPFSGVKADGEVWPDLSRHELQDILKMARPLIR